MIDFKGAIFDLDGTIADSTYVWQKVDKDFFKMYNMDVPEDYVEKISSMNFRQTAEYTKERFNFNIEVDEMLEIWHSMAVDEYRNNVVLKPFAKQYIEKLKNKGVKIGLCTASPKDFYEPLLIRTGIYDFFDTFSSGSHGMGSKDNPYIFEKTAENLGLLPRDCIVFDDILKAIRGAKSAGMKTVGVFDFGQINNKEIILKEADFYINSFQEII